MSSKIDGNGTREPKKLEHSHLSPEFYRAQLYSVEKLIAERIAIGNALQSDKALAVELSVRVKMREGWRRLLLLDKAGPAVVFDENGRIVELLNGRAIESIWHDSCVYALSGVARDRLLRSISQSGELTRAERLVRSAVANPASIEKYAFLEIFRWRSLFGAAAYRWLTVCAMELESKREAYKRAIKHRSHGAHRVCREYHCRVQSLRLMMTLACTAPDNEWLVDLATSFEWHVSPSQVVTRERSLTGAVQAAGATSYCGLAVVDRYLKRFADSISGVEALDAVMVLTAIALRLPERAGEILSEMYDASDSARMRGVEEPLIGSLLASANMAIWSQNEAERLVRFWGGADSVRSSTISDYHNSEDLCSFIVRSEYEYADFSVQEEGYFISILSLTCVDAESPEVFYSVPRGTLNTGQYSFASRALARSNTSDIVISSSKNFYLH
jgi:hypothetical protein